MTELEKIVEAFLKDPEVSLLPDLFDTFVKYPSVQVGALGITVHSETISVISKFFNDAEREWKKLCSRLENKRTTFFLNPNSLREKWKRDIHPQAFELIEWEEDENGHQ